MIDRVTTKVAARVAARVTTRVAARVAARVTARVADQITAREAARMAARVAAKGMSFKKRDYPGPMTRAQNFENFYAISCRRRAFNTSRL